MLVCGPQQHIRSTLAGSCMNPHTGAIVKEKLKENMSLAVDAYVSRVNGCPCGDTEIQLFRGPDSSEQQEAQEKLLIFLKGSNKNKEVLHCQDPTLYAHFKLVWTVRKKPHGLLSYVFHLICCHNSDCPLFRWPTTRNTWFPENPPLTHLPLSSLDPERPWGSPTVLPVKASVPGITPHNLLMSLTIEPSPKLRNHQQSLWSNSLGDNSILLNEEVQSAAKEVLLPPEECKIWLQQLQTVIVNRRQGARKAAATHQAKKALQASHTVEESPKGDNNCFCGDVWMCILRRDGWTWSLDWV